VLALIVGLIGGLFPPCGPRDADASRASTQTESYSPLRPAARITSPICCVSSSMKLAELGGRAGACSNPWEQPASASPRDSRAHELTSACKRSTIGRGVAAAP